MYYFQEIPFNYILRRRLFFTVLVVLRQDSQTLFYDLMSFVYCICREVALQYRCLSTYQIRVVLKCRLEMREVCSCREVSEVGAGAGSRDMILCGPHDDGNLCISVFSMRQMRRAMPWWGYPSVSSTTDRLRLLHLQRTNTLFQIYGPSTKVWTLWF